MGFAGAQPILQASSLIRASAIKRIDPLKNK
jgi:hypothetical protein